MTTEITFTRLGEEAENLYKGGIAQYFKNDERQPHGVDTRIPGASTGHG